MRHRKAGRKFTMSAAHRRSLFRNLATSLILKGQIQTTLGKAKDLKRVVEKLIATATTDSLHNRRGAYSYLLDKDAVHKLYTDLAPRYRDVAGGYTRVVRTGFRHGDAAEMAMIQLIEREAPAAPEKTKKKSTTRKAAKKKAAEPTEAAV